MNKGVDKVLFNKMKSYLGDQYRPSDDEIINLYCETHAFYKRLQKEVAKESLTLRRERDGVVSYIKNPLAVELTKTVRILNDLLKSLGLVSKGYKNKQDRKKLSSSGGEARVEEISFEDF